MVHVDLLDRGKLWYQLDRRNGVSVLSASAEGYFTIISMNASQYSQVYSVISREDPPRDGVSRCQDWVFEAVLSLEAEDLVPDGTSAWIESLVGKSSSELALTLRDRWVPARR